MAVALLFLFVAVVALVTMLGDPYQMDFVSYWAAARLVLAGNPAGAYDVALHRAVELGAIPLAGALPFAYPPCFLVAAGAVRPALLSGRGRVWVLLTFAAYGAAMRRWAPDRIWLALSFPPLLVNAITGQAGFLTAALFVAGMALLPKRPFARRPAARPAGGEAPARPRPAAGAAGGARMAGARRRGRLVGRPRPAQPRSCSAGRRGRPGSAMPA